MPSAMAVASDMLWIRFDLIMVSFRSAEMDGEETALSRSTSGFQLAAT